MAATEEISLSGALPKVLVVDDSRMVRASISKHVRGRFEIREESDGEAGWQALLVDPAIQVVLSDIDMPHLDGYGLLERIRASKVPRVHELPVIMISGDEDDDARARALKLGANDFIAKGISSVELLARLESLSYLARTRRELEESRAALAAQQPVDPVSGLNTGSYLQTRGEQDVALANRHQTDISAMVIEIDHYGQLIEWHGVHVAQLITRKLAKILATRVRKGDTVAQLESDRFAVLSPSTDLMGSCAFALRLQRAMEKLVMVYRDERIRISITAGVASSAVDGGESISHLVGVATGRVREGVAAGGNRIVSNEGEVDQDAIEQHLKQATSIDYALTQIRSGTVDEVAGRLPEIIATLLPLLELAESRLNIGLPLAELERLGKLSEKDGDGTQTLI